jgi:glucan biosynthesis protein
MEAAYNLRPSVWVKPISMPRGKVSLFEFHSKDETNDTNVVLFYEPEAAPELRRALSLQLLALLLRPEAAERHRHRRRHAHRHAVLQPRRVRGHPWISAAGTLEDLPEVQP